MIKIDLPKIVEIDDNGNFSVAAFLDAQKEEENLL